MSKKIDKILVCDNIIFQAVGRVSTPQKMYHDGQGVVYRANKCRLATDEEISYFEDMKQEYGNVTAISL